MDFRKPIIGQNGFTLVEIVVSVVLLGVALTTIIGMQVNYARGYINEEYRTHAALYSQYLMSIIESEKSPPDQGSESGDLKGYLEEVGFFDENFQADSSLPLAGWKYNLEVSSIDIFELEDALRRIDLGISWGETISERYQVIYYMKNDERK